MASYQYVYVMQNLSKVFPGGRELFKGITLSFLPGAKIGVLGVNGAGKSTLLKIMAGVDREFNGEAWAAAPTAIRISDTCLTTAPPSPAAVSASTRWRSNFIPAARIKS